jgi:hypothetical protein
MDRVESQQGVTEGATGYGRVTFLTVALAAIISAGLLGLSYTCARIGLNVIFCRMAST